MKKIVSLLLAAVLLLGLGVTVFAAGSPTGSGNNNGTPTTPGHRTATKPGMEVDNADDDKIATIPANQIKKTSVANAKKLSDADRDLLERLCMGEFGSGGFIGASLIAQAVKDAMCFDGYTSVADVIRECHYTGSTSIGTNSECRQAVRYIFDDNRDAVQHRIMYMYNPYMVQSAFHESQNFILSYAGVRFFDRWGY